MGYLEKFWKKSEKLTKKCHSELFKNQRCFRGNQRCSALNQPCFREKQTWNSAVSALIFSSENFRFQRCSELNQRCSGNEFSGNEQRWNRPESILNQSWSALNVSETSTRVANAVAASSSAPFFYKFEEKEWKNPWKLRESINKSSVVMLKCLLIKVHGQGSALSKSSKVVECQSKILRKESRRRKNLSRRILIRLLWRKRERLLVRTLGRRRRRSSNQACLAGEWRNDKTFCLALPCYSR